MDETTGYTLPTDSQGCTHTAVVDIETVSDPTITECGLLIRTTTGYRVDRIVPAFYRSGGRVWVTPTDSPATCADRKEELDQWLTECGYEAR